MDFKEEFRDGRYAKELVEEIKRIYNQPLLFRSIEISQQVNSFHFVADSE
jgi:hypothetical protein